ncbi:hypothetical protein AKJ16_DCAP02560 [Drosera capensis]
MIKIKQQRNFPNLKYLKSLRTKAHPSINVPSQLSLQLLKTQRDSRPSEGLHFLFLPEIQYLTGLTGLNAGVLRGKAGFVVEIPWALVDGIGHTT